MDESGEADGPVGRAFDAPDAQSVAYFLGATERRVGGFGHLAGNWDFLWNAVSNFGSIGKGWVAHKLLGGGSTFGSGASP